MADYEGVTAETACLATIQRHVTEVRLAMLRVRQELERRAEAHDASKWSPEELPGFSRINATARQHPYGSEEYRASIRAEKPTVERHQRLNSHHPEAHEPLSSMGWLDLVEMVCDWWAATRTYGTTPWTSVLETQFHRWPWTPEQWWLILEIAGWLAGKPVPEDLRGLRRHGEQVLHTVWVEAAGKRLPTKMACKLEAGDRYWRSGEVWEVLEIYSVAKTIEFRARSAGGVVLEPSLAALAPVPMAEPVEGRA